MDDGVVEGAVGFDVGQVGAGGAGEAVEGADLVEDVGFEVGGWDVDEAASEAGEVVVGDLCADANAVVSCVGECG